MSHSFIFDIFYFRFVRFKLIDVNAKISYTHGIKSRLKLSIFKRDFNRKLDVLDVVVLTVMIIKKVQAFSVKKLYFLLHVHSTEAGWLYINGWRQVSSCV